MKKENGRHGSRHENIITHNYNNFNAQHSDRKLNTKLEVNEDINLVLKTRHNNMKLTQVFQCETVSISRGR